MLKNVKLNGIGDVFKPNALPDHTYVDRRIDEYGDTYTEQLQKALLNPGTLIAITGASKSGKTVLCHKAIRNTIIDLSASQIESREDFWNQIGEQLELPDEVQIKTSQSENDVEKTQITGELSIKVAKINISAGKDNTGSKGNEISHRILRSQSSMMKYIIDNDFVLVIDDFHYASEDIQLYIARTIKTYLINGLKVIILSLPHRADDAIRLNPDLIGRTSFIEIAPWSIDELKEIGLKGFPLLNIAVDDVVLEHMAVESISSPQLMQDICFNLAYRMEKNNATTVSREMVAVALRETVKKHKQVYSHVLKAALEGPAQGKNKRTHYILQDGRQVDIYMLLLISISSDPPELSLPVQEIQRRFSNLLAENNVKQPRSIDISNAVKNIKNIMKERAKNLDTIDWKAKTLYILDSFLLFYLRCSDDWKNA
ncbi:hypothetical protein I6E26_04195 [Anaerovibrio lipolyticus]|uniref:hypothetical protein n=1 Tax=Anaerovibrio lipolyticus TaxID=82374 RepID=UPI001F1CAD66|nr:hypothetical protein [Anaerovibrio lipolyticus]MCF2600758.1 hypothetical protein [Anaerovibrio lipolyticus]